MLAYSIALAPAGLLAAPMYHLIDLGAGDYYSLGINQRAQIAGSMGATKHNKDNGQAAIYRKGTWTTLPDQGHGSSALGIDDHDDLVGDLFVLRKDQYPVFWPKGGQSFEIIPLPYQQGQTGIATSISPGGNLVVGDSDFGYCWEWNRSGVAVDLGSLGGGACFVGGVNDAGQIVGESQVPGGDFHAFLMTDGVMRDLGTLPAGHNADLRAVNALGHAAGFSDLDNYAEEHAIFWNGDQLVDLGDTTWYATGMNDLDDVVGIGLSGNKGRAFLYWHVDGSIIYLDELVDNIAGWRLSSNVFIDNGGRIVGQGFYQGHRHVYRLVPRYVGIKRSP
jgi:probable HAF family extracellular repeat protein